MLNGVLGAMVKDTKIEIKAKVLNWKDFFFSTSMHWMYYFQ
jgi:hypothetical protein